MERDFEAECPAAQHNGAVKQSHLVVFTPFLAAHGRIRVQKIGTVTSGNKVTISRATIDFTGSLGEKRRPKP
jgi:hypothetical protein